MFASIYSQTSVRPLLGALAGAAVLALMTGCALQSTAIGTSESTAPAVMKGGVMGGQSPIYGSTIGLWLAGAGSSSTANGYGMGATTLLTGPVVTTNSAGGFSIPNGGLLACSSGINNVAVTAGGSGYTAAPTVVFSGGGGTGVAATATITAGQVTGVAITSSGSGYTAMPTISFTGGAGTGATAIAINPQQVYVTATGGDSTGGTTNNNTAVELVAALGPCSNLTSSTFIQINEVTTVAAAFGLAQFFGGFGTTPTITGSSAPYTSITGDIIGAPYTNNIGLINAFATAHNLANTSTGVATQATTAATGTNYYLTATDQQRVNTIANILSDCVNQATSTAGPCTTLFGAVTPTYLPYTINNTTPTAATAPTDVFQAAVYMALNPTSTNSTASATNINNLMVLQTPFEPFTPALTTNPSDWTLAIQYTGTGINYLSSAAVDANGDIWFSNANTTGGVVQLNGGTGADGGTAGVTGGVIAFTSGAGGKTANGTRQVAIDQLGNAWYGGYNASYIFRTSSGGATSYEFPAGTSQLPYAIGIDGNDIVTVTTSSGNLFTIAATATSGSPTSTTAIISGSSSASLAITSGTSSPTAYAPTKGGSGLFEFTTGLTPTTLNGGAVVAAGTLSYGAAVDANNKAWIVNESATGSLYKGSGTATFTQIASTCMVTPQMVAVDGADNIWVSSSTGTEPLCEFSNSGALLSNTTGYTHGMSTGRGIAIDPSGNIWVTNYATGASFVTEIVGSATPSVTPLSVALANSTVGVRP